MDEILVIVVDGSLNLSSYWDNIKTILESIVRRFCANGASTSSAPSDKKYNLSLIVNAVIYDSAAQSDGTIRLDSFLHTLSNLNFDEDSLLCNSGVSDGLSTALMLLQFTKKQQQTQFSWKQHCVLVMASHPSPDAETLAHSFIKSFISFSVICPRDMPTATTIYEADNLPYPLTIAVQHPRLLLFISDHFPEAREALEMFAPENNTNTHSEQDPLSYISFSNEEHGFLTKVLFQPQIEQQKNDEYMPTIEAVLGSSSITQQEMQTGYLQKESIQMNPEELDVTANLLTSQAHILEGTATSSTNPPSDSIIQKPNNTFYLSTSWLMQNDPEKILGSSNSKISPPRTNAIRLDNVPSSSRLTCSSSTNGSKSDSNTIMQTTGVNSSHGKMVVLGENNGMASMRYPTTKHVMSTNDAHIVTSRVTNGSSSNISWHLKEPQMSTSPLSHPISPRNFKSGGISGHIKAWEGSIASRGPGVTILVSRLAAYKKTTIPEKIFENWPKMMQLDHLVPCTQPHSSPIQVNKIPLVFSVLDSCPIWDHMKEKNLCGYIALSGQMLKLWISEDKSILMGTLFEVLKTNSNHQ